MRKLVINLDRSTERLSQFCQANAHVPGIERVSAVEGSRIDRQQLVSGGVMHADMPYTDGAIGAALSHLYLWNEIRQGTDPVTVLEDDAILCANFEQEQARLLQTIGPDWDFVLWGYNFDTPLTYHILPGVSMCVANFDQASMRKVAGKWPGRSVQSVLFPLHRTLGIACYSVSPRGAEKLFRFCTPIRPMITTHPGLPDRMFNTGIDNMMAHAWPAMQAFVAVPALALTKNELSISTIQPQTASEIEAAANP